MIPLETDSLQTAISTKCCNYENTTVKIIFAKSAILNLSSSGAKSRIFVSQGCIRTESVKISMTKRIQLAKHIEGEFCMM